MSVPIVQAAALDVVLPTMLDSAAIVDQSDASQMKLALLTEQHMLFSRNFAEIRSADTDISGVVVLNTSTYVGPIPFTSNVSLSAAVAGDPDAGTVLTADQANDKIVIPPKTAVFVEFSIVVVSIAGTDNVVVTPHLGATAQTQAMGTGAIALTTAGAVTPLVVHGSGYVENTSASAADLTLKAKTSAMGLSVVYSQGFLRSRWEWTLP